MSRRRQFDPPPNGDDTMATVETPVLPGAAPLAPADTRLVLRAMSALRKGDFSVRLPDDWSGLAGKLADAFNETVELNQRMHRELTRLSRVVGREGKLGQRGELGDVSGAWST